MKKILLLCFLMLLIPINAYAKYEVVDSRCTNSYMVSLREEAQNVVYRISRNTDNLYNIYFYNISNNIDVKNSNNNAIIPGQITNLKPGSKLNISIEASNETYCKGYKMYSKTIIIPNYNKYYGTDLCIGHEDLEICSENINITLSEEEFKKELEKSNESSKIDTIIEEPDDNDNYLDILYEYNIYIYVVLVLIVGIVIYIIFKNNYKKDNIL